MGTEEVQGPGRPPRWRVCWEFGLLASLTTVMQEKARLYPTARCLGSNARGSQLCKIWGVVLPPAFWNWRLELLSFCGKHPLSVFLKLSAWVLSHLSMTSVPSLVAGSGADSWAEEKEMKQGWGVCWLGRHSLLGKRCVGLSPLPYLALGWEGDFVSRG